MTNFIWSKMSCLRSFFLERDIRFNWRFWLCKININVFFINCWRFWFEFAFILCCTMHFLSSYNSSRFRLFCMVYQFRISKTSSWELCLINEFKNHIKYIIYSLCCKIQWLSLRWIFCSFSRCSLLIIKVCLIFRFISCRLTESILSIKFLCYISHRFFWFFCIIFLIRRFCSWFKFKL